MNVNITRIAYIRQDGCRMLRTRPPPRLPLPTRFAVAAIRSVSPLERSRSPAEASTRPQQQGKTGANWPDCGERFSRTPAWAGPGTAAAGRAELHLLWHSGGRGSSRSRSGLRCRRCRYPTLPAASRRSPARSAQRAATSSTWRMSACSPGAPFANRTYGSEPLARGVPRYHDQPQARVAQVHRLRRAGQPARRRVSRRAARGTQGLLRAHDREPAGLNPLPLCLSHGPSHPQAHQIRRPQRLGQAEEFPRRARTA